MSRGKGMTKMVDVYLTLAAEWRHSAEQYARDRAMVDGSAVLTRCAQALEAARATPTNQSGM